MRVRRRFVCSLESLRTEHSFMKFRSYYSLLPPSSRISYGDGSFASERDVW